MWHEPSGGQKKKIRKGGGLPRNNGAAKRWVHSVRRGKGAKNKNKNKNSYGIHMYRGSYKNPKLKKKKGKETIEGQEKKKQKKNQRASHGREGFVWENTSKKTWCSVCSANVEIEIESYRMTSILIRLTRALTGNTSNPNIVWLWIIWIIFEIGMWTKRNLFLFLISSLAKPSHTRLTGYLVHFNFQIWF